MQVAIGQKLEIRGRNFRRGRNKNTVVFKRTGGKAVFVKADVGTHEAAAPHRPGQAQARARDARRRAGADPLPPARPRQEVRQALHQGLALAGHRAGAAADAGDAPARGRRRRLRRRRHPQRRRDRRRQRSAVDDNTELRIKTDGCKADSDGDGVNDGYEYPVGAGPQRRRVPGAQTRPALPREAPLPERAVRGRRHRLRRRLADARRGVLALAVLPRPRRARPADLLGRQPVLALRPRRLPATGRAAPRHDPFAKQADFVNWAERRRLRQRAPAAARPSTLRDSNRDGTVSAAPSVDGGRAGLLPLGAAPTSTSTPTASCPTTSATRTPTA